MGKKVFGTSIIGLVCLSMFAALSAQAKQPGNSALQPLGGSVMDNSFKVLCGAGLLPLAIEGKFEGVIDVPSGKISFPGKHVKLGYCGHPETGESSVKNDVTSSIIDLNGKQLKCTNGLLPIFLEGSAEGSLNTTKGIVNLSGDNNKIAVCLASANSID